METSPACQHLSIPAKPSISISWHLSRRRRRTRTRAVSAILPNDLSLCWQFCCKFNQTRFNRKLQDRQAFTFTRNTQRSAKWSGKPGQRDTIFDRAQWTTSESVTEDAGHFVNGFDSYLCGGSHNITSSNGALGLFFSTETINAGAWRIETRTKIANRNPTDLIIILTFWHQHHHHHHHHHAHDYNHQPLCLSV